MGEAGGHPLTPNSLGPGRPLPSARWLGSHVPGQVLAQPGTLSLPRLFLKLNFLKMGWLILKRMGRVSGWEELEVACRAWPGWWEHGAGPRGLPSPPSQSSHHLLKVHKTLEGSGVLEGAAGVLAGIRLWWGTRTPTPTLGRRVALPWPLLVWVLDTPGGRACLSFARVWIGQEECGRRGAPGYEAGDPEASPGEADPGRTSCQTLGSVWPGRAGEPPGRPDKLGELRGRWSHLGGGLDCPGREPQGQGLGAAEVTGGWAPGPRGPRLARKGRGLQGPPSHVQNVLRALPLASFLLSSSSPHTPDVEPTNNKSAF